MAINTTIVNFHGDQLLAVEYGGKPYVAVKPICERLGLNWKSQHRKLSTRKVLWGIHTMTIPSAGGQQETVAMPLIRVAGWLFTINAKRVKEEYREALELYQEECADVLHDHFMARIHNDVEAYRGLNWRLKVDAITRKPLWAKIAAAVKEGLTYHELRKTVSASGPKIQTAVDDMIRLELIDQAPIGTPAHQQTLPLESANV